MNQIAPENPSHRQQPFLLKYKCLVCEKVWEDKDKFISHLERTGHRICYKCGIRVGTTLNWMEGKFVARREILNNNIAIWKYYHVNCPSCEPSRRKS